MSKIDTGGPAYPCEVVTRSKQGTEYDKTTGMTWLDVCAMKAMQAMFSNANIKIASRNPAATDAEVIADCSYSMAKAMLAEKRRLEGEE